MLSYPPNAFLLLFTLAAIAARARICATAACARGGEKSAPRRSINAKDTVADMYGAEAPDCLSHSGGERISQTHGTLHPNTSMRAFRIRLRLCVGWGRASSYVM